MKKILLLSILIITVFVTASCNSLPEDTGDFVCSFNKSDKTATIKEYIGNDTDVVIPDYFGDYKVTIIEQNAFSEQYELTSVEFPKYLRTIEMQAFRLCISLEKIKLPEELQSIGKAAFSDCRALKEVFIDKNVKEIGLGTFAKCDELETITVDKNNTVFSSDSYGVLIQQDKTILQYPTNSTYTSYKMPDTITEIAPLSFADTKNLEEVVFSPNLITIGAQAFDGSNILKAQFGNSLKTIEANAFRASKITKVSFGNSIEKIADGAFSDCFGLTEIIIPSSVKEIGKFAFNCCTSVEKFTVDKNNAHYSNDEYGVLFNKDMTVLINYPTARTEKQYTIPDNTQKVSAQAFIYNLNLEKITVPDFVEIIEDRAFGYCNNLKEVVYIGTQPEFIAENAFIK